MALTTDDMVQIQQLYAKFSHAIDTGNTELFLSAFAPDGTFTRLGRTLRGHEELREMGSHGVAGRQRHFNTNILIDGDGDHATGSSYLMLTRAVKQEPLIATYTDTFVKLDGRWFIQSRDVKADERPMYEKYLQQQKDAGGTPA